MNNTLLKLAAPLIAAFTLAGCAAHRQGLHEATVRTAVVLSAANDFQMVAACSGEKGRAGVLSYSESLNEARLSLVDGNKVTVVPVKDDPADPNAAFQKLNDWCYPK
jgi:hypothetical protein